MTATAPRENPYAGQGAVLLDIGGDVGALIVTMPAAMEGTEVEIQPMSGHSHRSTGHGHDVHEPRDHHAHDYARGHNHEHDPSVDHNPHVAVVNRPVKDTHVASLVFPELVEGSYELRIKGTHDVRLIVDVHGGQVADAAWPP